MPDLFRGNRVKESNKRATFLQQFITVGDAARLLGVNRVTIWRWVKGGKVEAYRIGRGVLIEKAELEKLRR